MQRKPGFPVANCSIKMPDGMPAVDNMPLEDDGEMAQRRQQLINFGHMQWGFNNWSWSVTKQDLDFVDFSNGKFCAGVCAFVSVTVKSLDIHRENIGYATSLALNKGSAIHNSRKCAVTNALRETLLSFGGKVATELLELVGADSRKHDLPTPAPPPLPPVPPTPPEPENNQNLSNKPTEPKNSPLSKNVRKDSSDSNSSVVRTLTGPPIKNIPNPPPPPVAKAHPIPVNLPPANRPVLPANAPRPPPPQPHPRPNSNEGRPPETAAEAEARAERKRRQQRAQEEFRLKMMHSDDKQREESGTSLDALLAELPSQDIALFPTGEAAGAAGVAGKRRSPGPDAGAKKRAPNNMSKLDILTD